VLYLVLGVRALGRRGSFWPAAVVARWRRSSTSGAFLWPSLVYLLWVGGAGQGATPSRRPRLLLLLIPLAALAVG
jgi:hypothetical protein